MIKVPRRQSRVLFLVGLPNGQVCESPEGELF